MGKQLMHYEKKGMESLRESLTTKRKQNADFRK